MTLPRFSVHEAPSHRPWEALWCPAAAAMAAVLLWLGLADGEVQRFTAEGGLVEALTEWLYFIMACVFAFASHSLSGPSTRASLVVMTLAFGAREMDLHKAYTGKSVLKVSFYLGDAPAHQKLIALVVLAAIALAFVTLVRRHAAAVWRGWLRAEPVAVTIMIFLVTMVASKILDRSINVLQEDFGVHTLRSIHTLVGALEEILELSLPVIAGLGWWQARRLAAARPAGQPGRREANITSKVDLRS